MTEPAEPHHHFSHTSLLRPDHAAPGSLDAILVPTNRPTGFVRGAMGLAAELDCLLLVLCSKWSTASLVINEAERHGVRAVAVDVPPRARLPRPTADDVLAGQPFRSRTDTSMKRNVGLAVAHMMPGWRAVLFLDDDIAVSAADVRGAAGLLGEYDAVGLANGGFPDNSVVCHANRAAGGVQDTFIGGGALVVPTSSRSYFPNVYNEDWFFLFEHIRERRVAVTGLAEQKAYDPFDGPGRARRQEFGDCLAEGIFELLDDGRDLAAAGPDFWRDYLGRRAAFIEGISRRLPDTADGARVRRALRAAQESGARITPELCIGYLAAWQRDRHAWEDFLAGLPKLSDVHTALRHLSLRPTGREQE
jgi:mono/diheme cytochrome c family protein